MPTYADVDVIKALFAYDAKGGRPTGLRRFIDNTFPGITDRQLNRCVEVALAGPHIDPVIDAQMADLAEAALRKAGCDDLGEFLAEGSHEANELLEKLKNLGGPDSSRKLMN
jgi:hypothetical protein